MLKGFAIFLFILLVALVTFFGLGPVLLADGSFGERMWTLAVVILIYVVLIFGFRFVMRRLRK